MLGGVVTNAITVVGLESLELGSLWQKGKLADCSVKITTLFQIKYI